MNTTAEIYLWGTRVGIIHQELDKSYAAFEYDEEFLKSNIQIAPVMMPLNSVIYEFPLLAGEPFFGLPGLVADSLPDDFGNKVIEQWLASQGKSISDFTAIDRLCYMGKRSICSRWGRSLTSVIRNRQYAAMRWQHSICGN